jgi:hypothetical protein
MVKFSGIFLGYDLRQESRRRIGFNVELQKEGGALKKIDFGRVSVSNRVTGAMEGCEKAGPI